MCLFITAILPRSADLADLQPLALQFGKSLTPQSNASLDQQLDPREQAAFTTAGHCDCGTSLGARCRRPAFDRDKARDRMRRKGWGVAKVERALGEMEATWRTAEARDVANAASDLEAWEDFLTALLKSGTGARAALLLHQYRGGVGQEVITLAGREVVALSRAALVDMREDVIREFILAA